MVAGGEAPERRPASSGADPEDNGADESSRAGPVDLARSLNRESRTLNPEP